jgi:hypothetical protein
MFTPTTISAGVPSTAETTIRTQMTTASRLGGPSSSRHGWRPAGSGRSRGVGGRGRAHPADERDAIAQGRVVRSRAVDNVHAN